MEAILTGWRRTISATLSDGTVDALLDEIEEFLTGIRHGAEPDRILATVLFHRYRRLYKAGSRDGAVPWPGGEHGGGLFPDRF